MPRGEREPTCAPDPVAHVVDVRSADGGEPGDPTLCPWVAHGLPRLHRTPVVAEHVHRRARAHRLGDREEVVGQLGQGEPLDRTRVRGRAHPASVVGHDVEVSGEAVGHRVPELVGVRPAVHEQHRRGVRVAGLEDGERDVTVADGASGRFGGHGRHHAQPLTRNTRGSAGVGRTSAGSHADFRRDADERVGPRIAEVRSRTGQSTGTRTRSTVGHAGTHVARRAGHSVTKQVKQLDRVVIRFAGDSGDGMQLTGDRFTQETASFGNDLSTLPNFPAEIRAPQGTLPGVSSFQVHFADHDILTPGDRPDVLVSMNPAALRANLPDLPNGATIIVDTNDFTPRNLTKAGYAENPLENDSLAEFALHAVDLTGMTVEAVKEFGLSRKDASRAKNMFALGLVSWMYGRPTDGTITFLERRFAKVPEIRDANIAAFRAGLELRRDHRGLRRPVRDQACPDGAGHLPQHHRQPRAVLRPGRRRGAVGAAAVPRLLPDHPGQRHPPRAQQAQAVRRHDLPGRGRDRRCRCRAGRLVRRRPRGHHHVGPGRRAEVGDHRPRRDDRAAAGGGRRAARRSFHRAADQDRAGRPAAGDVRAQRRGTAADRRPAVPRRLLRRRGRGDPHRDHLPHPGDAALRRLPGQRLRAVAHPRGRGAAGDRPGVRHRAQPRSRRPPRARRSTSSGPTCATRTPSRGRGPSPGPRGWSTASAAWRRATATATSPTTRPTTT